MGERLTDARRHDRVEELLDLSARIQHVVSAVAGRHELTPQQFGLLRMLRQPVSMRAFAEELACDPSNVTGLVDRVERLGLAERVVDPGDRRIRLLVLTPKGRQLRDDLNREVAHELSAELDAPRVPGASDDGGDPSDADAPCDPPGAGSIG
jgi:DNA-binding MarR family transcriptional regulator